eukprot:3044667-Rhodomonas_salina.1
MESQELRARQHVIKGREGSDRRAESHRAGSREGRGREDRRYKEDNAEHGDTESGFGFRPGFMGRGLGGDLRRSS